VVRTRVGYTGGRKDHPTYHDLGDHSEALQVDFDPEVVSYEELLDVFWSSHDPTAGAWSRQYKAALFVDGAAQRTAGEASKARLESRLGERVRTEILPAGPFWAAEDYHQKWYLRRRGGRWLDWVQSIYPEPDAFRDATAAARLNGWFGGNRGHATPEVLARDFGLAPEEGGRLARELGWRPGA